MLDEPTLTREELLAQTIDRFWESIPPLWNRVRSNIRTTASERFNISVEQFHILRHIRRGVNSVSDLAEERCISRPAISQVVDVLVHKGLVTRLQDENDRRYIKLALSEDGATLLKAIFDSNRAWMIARLEALDPAELTACIKAMETLKNTFDDIFIQP